MRMGLNYSRSLNDPASDVIALTTGGYWSHVSMRFELDEVEPQSIVYFESIWKTDPDTGKSGLRGPIPIANLEDWAKEDPHHKVYFQPWLPVTPQEALEAYSFLMRHVPLVKYAKLQLAQNVHYALTGRWTIRRSNKPDLLWQCAETIGRALPLRIQRDFFGIGDAVFGMLVPSGTRGIGIMERMEELLRGHKRSDYLAVA